MNPARDDIDGSRRSAQSGPYGECLRPCRRQVAILILRNGRRPRLEGWQTAGLMVRDGARRLLTMRSWSLPCVSIWSICSSSSRSRRPAASRAVRGRVHLALASASERIKGLELALGVSLLKRGRRGVELTAAGESLLDHARIVIHNVEAMRAISPPLPAARGRACICSPTPPACRNICRRRSPPSLRPIPAFRSTSRSARAATLRARLRQAPPISGLPPSTRCPRASNALPSARIAWCWRCRGRTNWQAAGRSTSREVVEPRFRRPDHLERAACPCQRARGQARRAAALPGAAEQFRRHRPDGGGRHRRCRDAGSRSAAAARAR